MSRPEVEYISFLSRERESCVVILDLQVLGQFAITHVSHLLHIGGRVVVGRFL